MEQPNRLLRVFVLGRFEVEQGGHLIENEQWRSGKARSLFKILLARRGFQISRQEVAELLWPELDQERATNNLHQAVYSLRRTLEPERERSGVSLYLKSEGSKLLLNPALISWIDLEQFKQLFRQAELTGDLNLYEQAAALYGGDYLPEDLYEDWSVYRRETLRQDWITLLLRLATLYQARGQDEKCQQCLHRILESDFSHEESVQKLMQALVENGRRDEAITLYRNFASKLHNRLSIEPLSETRQLYQNILVGKIGGGKNLGAGSGELETKTKVREVGIREGKQKADSPRPISELVGKSKPEPQKGKNLVHSPDLIGREVEQYLWQQCLNKALEGSKGNLTLLLGEAGIGKTYLAQNLTEQATQAGFEVMSTTCYPEQADLPFSAISILLQQALGKLKNQELEECLQYCSPELYRILPDLPSRMSGSVPPWWQVQSVEEGENSEFNKEGLFAAIAHVLTWLSRKQPLVLVLDNLQYLPDPAIRLLRYLLTNPNLQSLVILSTLRPINAGLAQPELGSLLSWAMETSQTIHWLDRLKVEEIQQLLTTRLNLSIRPSLVELVNQTSWGNPRLALELLATWHKEGYLRLVGGQWEMGETWNGQISPPVTAYIKRLVGNLSSDAQVLLLLASLIATRLTRKSVISPILSIPWQLGSRFETQNTELSFSFEILRQIVLHRSDGAGWWIDLDKTKLGQTLTELTGQKLIEEDGLSYRFTYPLLAEALAASLPYSQRQCWQEVIRWAEKKMENDRTGVENLNYNQI